MDVAPDTKILVIDDDRANRDSLAAYLEDCGFNVVTAADGRTGVNAFDEHRPTLVLADIDMPGVNGLDVLAYIQEHSPETPIILVSGVSSLENAVGALKLGAWDYLTKPIHDMAALGHAVGKALERYRLLQENQDYQAYLENEVVQRTSELREELAERIRAQHQLWESEHQFQQVFNSSSDAIVVVDCERRIQLANQAFEELTGVSQGEVVGRNCHEINLCHSTECMFERIPHETELVIYDAAIWHSDGTERACSVKATPFRTQLDKVTGVLFTFADVTQRKALEAQLRQSEKMEAIGQLAGGIAHDFNNLLAGILGSAELLEMKLPKDPVFLRYIKTIVGTAERASGLTRKLLTFSRKSARENTQFGINAIINEVVEILSHTIDRRIRIRRDLAADLPMIIGDASQVENALMNLGVNARDAMPEGGELLFATYLARIGEGHPTLRVGNYAEIRVSDTGTGIAPAILSRIFEPFFTTKEVNQGTGLGLAMVYGTAKDHGGMVDVKSELGVGTTFSVFLAIEPFEGGGGTPLAVDTGDGIVRGNGRILLAEDEDDLREMGTELLQEFLGYQVNVVRDGLEAVAFCNEHGDELDVVILDMMMPRMNGIDAAREIRRVAPNLPIVICSGSGLANQRELLAELDIKHVVRKPYRAAVFSQILAEIIK